MVGIFKLTRNRASTLSCDSSVLNLSNYVLSESETKLLQKGLTFVPSPTSVDKNALFNAGEAFKRRIKLEAFYKTRKTVNNRPTEFVKKSKFNPPNFMVPLHVNNFISDFDKFYQSFEPNRIPSNLPPDERRAIYSLRNNNSIIIRKADKGSTTVVLDRNKYIAEAENQLNNPKFYSKINDPNIVNPKPEIEVELQKLVSKNILDKSQYDFLLNSVDSGRDRVFYTLPKIHKSLSSWFEPNSAPPGRPIVSDVASPTNQIAKLISKKLKTLACSHDSYIRDTNHFLERLRKIKVPQNAALVTLDVSSLYTNIDNTKGLESIRQAMANSPDSNRGDDEILNLLKICLNSNIFNFNGTYYHQRNGAAMGHGYCVEYANIYMAQWEKGALSKSPLLPILWVRFIDDVFMIWTHGYDEFLNFLKVLNEHDESIKLTYEYNLNSINFLDVTVFKGFQFSECNILDTKIYFKETDSHQLLHKKSYHPSHTFTGIVKSQLLRFSRICSDAFDFDTACHTLFAAIKPRGYSDRLLRRLKQEVRSNYSPENRSVSIDGSSGPCGGERCTRCSLVNSTNIIDINDKPFFIRDNLDCNSAAVIYAISCSKCNKFYIGETKNALRVRLNQHINDIKHCRDTSVSNHFNGQGHDLERDFHINPIMKAPETSYRKYLESRIIRKFNTEHPQGLNIREDGIVRNHAIVPFVLPYSDDSQNIGRATRSLLEKHKPTDKRYITAFSRHKNLRDILAPSKI